MERVSVFIDGANFYGGLRTINEKYTDTKFDFEKYLSKIVGKSRKLVSICYYNASLKKNENEEIFKKQQRFFSRLRKIPLMKVILCKRQKRFDGNGNHFYTIKGDDIHLAIDMLKGAYDNEFDTAILMSGDGDYTPLVKHVKAKGKKVEAYHFKKSVSLDLFNECDLNVTIDKKIVNKFFYRQTYRVSR